VTRILRAVYPSLDLGAVAFHRGVPHLVRLVRSQAITLPALLAPRRTRIYVGPGHWDPGTVEGLGTLVHEAYHALQAQESGWGFGPLRPFLVLYFACGAANLFRYHGHPMEEDAYRLAGRRRSRFESTFGSVDAAGVERESASLAALSSGLRFWRQLAASTPLVKRFLTPDARRAWAVALLGSPLVASWLLLWTGAAALVWLARLLVEGGGALIAGSLWGGGYLLSSIERMLRRGATADNSKR
jgi:hypothetical protein